MKSLREKKADQAREEYLKKLEDEAKLMTKLQKQEAEERIRRRKDFVTRLQQERKETAFNGVVLKAQEVANLQQNQLAQEEALAAELDIIRRQEIVDEKLRLHLRENCHELKELETQLRAAYINKAIAAQLAEKEANKLEDQIREQRARELLVKAMGSLDEQDREARLIDKKKKEEFKELLQDQIIEKERIRQEEFISFLSERKMADEILKKIRDDEIREMEEKREMQQKLKEEMEQFYKAREVWKAKERLTIQEEEEKIRRANEEKAKAEAQLKCQKKTYAANTDKLYQALARDIFEKQRQKEEREELVTTLLWKEKEENDNKKAREEMEKEFARKQEARETYQQIMAMKARQKQEEKEFELKIVEQMNLKREEEERKEREMQEQRRQIQINNRKYNEEAMIKNIQKRAEGMKLTQLINELEEKEEKRKAQLVEEERIRMLKEHAPKLLGYLPKGCLRKGDLEILGLSGNSPLPESYPLE